MQSPEGATQFEWWFRAAGGCGRRQREGGGGWRKGGGLPGRTLDSLLLALTGFVWVRLTGCDPDSFWVNFTLLHDLFWLCLTYFNWLYKSWLMTITSALALTDPDRLEDDLLWFTLTDLPASVVDLDWSWLAITSLKKIFWLNDR